MSDQDFDAVSRITARKAKLAQPRNTSLVSLSVQPTALPTEAAPLPEPEISAGMLRIETKINAAIQAVCTERKISRDTFVEAAWLTLAEYPDVLEEVIAVAQKRYLQRKARGTAKRAKSMEKYKDWSL